MAKFIDITGQQFNRLYVIECVGRNKYKKAIWRCRCDCGNEKVIVGDLIRNSTTKSCGCLAAEILDAHHQPRVPKETQMLREIWRAMINRCYDKDASGYEFYGAHGIKVCNRWRRSFEAFMIDVGPRPSATHSLDRENNQGHYTPTNCRWVTAKVQMRNTRRNRFITMDGETKTLAEWSELTGIADSTIWQRLDYGWDVVRALTTPPDRRFAHS